MLIFYFLFVPFLCRRLEKKFDLYYYDGLARQDEELRLTVGKDALNPLLLNRTSLRSAFLLNGKTGRSGGTTNGTVLHSEIFSDKKGITSDVLLFSRVYRNDRKITEPFASSHLVHCTYHAPW